MFVDYAKIHVHAGDGGDGCISFRREKYVPFGGPDGGDGGRGGHIFLEADRHMVTLLDLKARPHYKTKRGQHGGGNQRTGRDAEDLVVKVPLGTAVSDANGEELADLVEPGQQWMAARGGNGGKGNQHFASATNKAPRKFEYGGDGEIRTLVLELKVIADVGLVGLPNAGKSSLLGALTAATPKIASYPFTTIHPNLGVMQFDEDENSRCTIADIPGLIEGAHTGAGLGDRFLRHIERTRILVHLVAPEDNEPRVDPERLRYALELVDAELAHYGTALAAKPQIVCLTKIDMLTPEEIAEGLAALRSPDRPEPLAVSSVEAAGLGELANRIRALL